MCPALIQQFTDERQHILETCTRCGLCVKACKLIPYTRLSEIPPRTVQQEVLHFLQTGVEGATVSDRTWACMECFGCVKDVCPQGLNPLHLIEILRWEYTCRGKAKIPESNPCSAEALHRIIASIQTTEAEFSQIFTPTPLRQSKYVFFPGCNVYFQPEKILTALDVLAFISEEIAFVPGLDFCCGSSHIYTGAIEKAATLSAALLERLCAYEPEEVIVWCPTCQCRFATTLSQSGDLPFKVTSFAQFLVNHIQALPLQERVPPIRVTLHEACKSAYLGVDLTGPRELLQHISGITLHEMPRHGFNTSCCGSGAVDCFPESFARVRDGRLREAAKTKADVLVDVCHYCHDVFSRETNNYPYKLINYVTLLGESLGIFREDRFQKFLQWDDFDRIWQEVEPFGNWSPYSLDQINAAIRQLFLGA